MAMRLEPHDPATPVASIEELKALLVAGLKSEPRPMTEDDWDALRRRAVTNTELRKSV